MSNGVQCCFQRYEKKYLLTPEQYQGVLRGMRPYMKADRYSRYTICNLYYDTDNFQLIRTSLEKPVYKEKLRVRSYGIPGDHDRVFVELKKKYEGVVYKRRAVLEADTAARYIDQGQAPGEATQICREIDYFMESYHPSAKVMIAYDREAYAGIENPDLRITFDTNLRWRDTDLDLRKGDAGKPILPPDSILMEVKIPGAAPLWLAHLFSGLGIYATSFSKYGTWYKQIILGQRTFFQETVHRTQIPSRPAAAARQIRPAASSSVGRPASRSGRVAAADAGQSGRVAAARAGQRAVGVSVWSLSIRRLRSLAAQIVPGTGNSGSDMTTISSYGEDLRSHRELRDHREVLNHA